MLRYLLFCLFLTTSAWAQEIPQVVKLTQVNEGTLSHEVSGVGTFTPYSDVTLKAVISGQIEAVSFKDGDRAKDHQLLITLNNREQKAAVMKAESALALSENMLKRKQTLSNKKFISPQDLENAEAKVRSDRADLEQAKAALEKTFIYAPFDGVLSNRQVAKGSYVIEGDELVRIQDLTPIRLTFQVPQKEIPSLKVGDKVLATTDVYPCKTFEGKIEAVEPSVDEDTRSVKIFATFENKDEVLVPGLYGHARITSSQVKETVLLIPEQAIVVRPDSVNVYKKVGDKAVLTPITIGKRTADQAEVLTGLKKGDEIVLEGQSKIHDGSLIKVK
jgi:membrane fusion protein (multidrug efflux system)